MVEAATPGPWMVEPINDGESYQVTTSEDAGFRVVAETPFLGDETDEANARLIAAAPDLYEALESILYEDGAKSEVDRIADRVRAGTALARARGEV